MIEAQARIGSVIQIKEFTKRYGNQKAVDGLSLTVPEGSIFGLLGENGAGKTTTIQTLLDGYTLTTAGFDGTVQLWDWPQCVLTNQIQPIVTSVSPLGCARVHSISAQIDKSEVNRPDASVQAAVSRGS